MEKLCKVRLWRTDPGSDAQSAFRHGGIAAFPNRRTCMDQALAAIYNGADSGASAPFRRVPAGALQPQITKWLGRASFFYKTW